LRVFAHEQHAALRDARFRFHLRKISFPPPRRRVARVGTIMNASFKDVASRAFHGDIERASIALSWRAVWCGVAARRRRSGDKRYVFAASRWMAGSALNMFGVGVSARQNNDRARHMAPSRARHRGVRHRALRSQAAGVAHHVITPRTATLRSSAHSNGTASRQIVTRACCLYRRTSGTITGTGIKNSRWAHKMLGVSTRVARQFALSG